MSTPAIILVEPQFVGNLGAIARAMSNFGYIDLRIVGPAPKDEFDHKINERISKLEWALATERGHKILDQATFFSTLKEAIEGLGFVVGASGKCEDYHGGFQREFVSPKQLKQNHKIKNSEWGLVLGREDEGLCAEDVGYCDLLVKIPTNPEAPSMNLAVAASILLYELSSFDSLEIRPSKEKTHADKRDQKAKLDEVEILVEFTAKALEKTQFFKHPDNRSAISRLRKLFRGFELSRGDLLLFLEIIYQLKCWGQKFYEERSFFSVGKNVDPRHKD